MGLLETIIQVGGQIGGAAYSASQNDKAADRATAGQMEAFRIASDRYDKGAKDRVKGITQAEREKVKGIKGSRDQLIASQAEAEQELLSYEQQAKAIATQGMEQAAALAAQGFHEQAAEIRAGIDKQIASLREGQRAAQAKYDALAAQNEGGTNYLRETVGRGDALTEDQQYALDESRRTVGNQLRSSGFAGSGRTAAALLNKVEVDQKMNMMAQNRQAAQSAAGQMAGAYNGAVGASAAADQTTGQQVGAAQAAGGLAVGQSLLGARNAEAQGKLGTAEIGATSARRQGDISASASLGIGQARSTAASGIAQERATGALGRAEARATGREAPTGVGVTAARQSGTYAANATAANGKLFGDTIGGLGSYLTSRLKDANVDTQAAA